MQQQSFILSLRQRFKWLAKVSLSKLPSSICTRTTEVGGGKLSAETSALPRVRKGFLSASRLWALLKLPLHWKKVQPFLFLWKSATVTAPSMSALFGKHNFKRMRYPVQIIITALSMFYLGKNSFRNISLILKTAFNIKVSHTTVSNWCVKFAPLFDDMRIQLVSLLDLKSDECTPMKR